MPNNNAIKIVISGAAGLLGKNLIACLKRHGFSNIVAIDKDVENTRALRHLYPEVAVIRADLAEDNAWCDALANADVLICGHAQIGGLNPEPFHHNNIVATRRLLDVALQNKVRYLVHISTAAVNSRAVNLYSESKKQQETLVKAYAFHAVILRPTLMFGLFDRRNLGWIARFMTFMPLFPIPGSGGYTRQPLYVPDFCEVIRACIEQRLSGEYNVSGLTKITYVDLVRRIMTALQLAVPIVKIPYKLFKVLLKIYAVFDHNPPFTAYQLDAFTIQEEFEVIDWPQIFGVNSTPLDLAITETFS